MQKTNLKIQFSKVELNWLKEYVRFLDDSIERELREIKKTASKTDDERYIEKLIDDHHMVGFHFSKHTMYTAYILVHSFLERSLSDILAQISEDRPNAIKLSDLAGEDSIDRSKNYLKKVVSLDLSSGAWSEIKPYIEIRNLLVHSLGEIRDETTSKRKRIIHQFVASNTNIALESNSLSFGKELVYEYLRLTEKIFEDLLSSLSNWGTVRLANPLSDSIEPDKDWDRT